jgi:hypothetical protein
MEEGERKSDGQYHQSLLSGNAQLIASFLQLEEDACQDSLPDVATQNQHD